jgi:hypothetical protein
MKNENNDFTIIPAPAGVRGIFEIGGDDGPELEIQDVAFLRVDHDAVRDGGNAGTPMGYSLFGQLAEAFILLNGTVIADDSIYPDGISGFMKGCRRISMDGDKYKPLIDTATGQRIEWRAGTAPA